MRSVTRLFAGLLRWALLLGGSCLLLPAQGQAPKLRSVQELINRQDPGWVVVQEWLTHATNQVEVLPREPARAEKALYAAQVTTRSPMGAIVYETGGLLVDHGWLRILGSGSRRLNRSLIEWNLGKSMTQIGEQPAFLLIADDAAGGFFAINNGAFSPQEIGKVFYAAPDALEWESLGLGYSEFLTFCFAGDLGQFYQGLRWRNWPADVAKLDGTHAMHFLPPLWTREGKDPRKVSRRAVPVQEIWELYRQPR